MANPTAGQILRASDFDWQPIVCTSGTRPSSPTEGTIIYETDTDKVLVWNTVGWVLPRNFAGGILAMASGPDQIGTGDIAAGFGAEIAVFTTPAVQTFANRRYRPRGRMRFAITANICTWKIRRGSGTGGTVIALGEVPGATRGNGENSPFEGIDTPGAQAAQQWTVCVVMNTGTGTVRNPSVFYVEDAGAN